MTAPAEQGRFLALLEERKKILHRVVNSYCWIAEDRRGLVQEITTQLRGEVTDQPQLTPSTGGDRFPGLTISDGSPRGGTALP